MTANYLVIVLIFFAGAFLLLVSVLNAPFLFKGKNNFSDSDEVNSQVANHGLLPDPAKVLSKGTAMFYLNFKKKIIKNRLRWMYGTIGAIIILLGIIALYNGFLNEPIEF